MSFFSGGSPIFGASAEAAAPVARNDAIANAAAVLMARSSFASLFPAQFLRQPVGDQRAIDVGDVVADVVPLGENDEIGAPCPSLEALGVAQGEDLVEAAMEGQHGTGGRLRVREAEAARALAGFRGVGAAQRIEHVGAIDLGQFGPERAEIIEAVHAYGGAEALHRVGPLQHEVAAEGHAHDTDASVEAAPA